MLKDSSDRRLDGRALYGLPVMAADGGSGGLTSGSLCWLGLPPDLAATVGLVVLADLFVLLPVLSDTPLRVLFGLPFLLFLPGYALVSALFPERGPADADDVDSGEWTRLSGRIDGVERAALSFGLSLAIVPVVGLALHFTPWGIRILPIIAVLSLVTLSFVLIATRRRRQLPVGERFTVPYREWISAARADFFAPETRTDAALNAVLVVSIVVALAFTGYAVGIPKATEKFTEFYVLNEQEDGELVAGDYPTDFEVGESRSVVLGIKNNEHRQVSYSVVVFLQNVSFVDNDTVIERESELERLRVNLEHNETWQQNFAISPTFAGDRLRIQFLLFRGDIPPQPRMENSYHELHLWISVTESD